MEKVTTQPAARQPREHSNSTSDGFTEIRFLRDFLTALCDNRFARSLACLDVAVHDAQRVAVVQALEQRPAHLDVILTGPAMGPALMALADQVTQLRRGL